MSAILVNIDRIVLTDLDVAADRAKRIQQMLEVELEGILLKKGIPDDLAACDISALSPPTVCSANAHSDSHLASSLALIIDQALRSLNGE